MVHIGSNGSLNVRIGHNPPLFVLEKDRSKNNESYDSLDSGAIDVADAHGNYKAGIYVNYQGNGVVYANQYITNAIPSTKNKTQISYASIQGPEIAAYDRGTAQLFNGEAFIDFKNHFQSIANTTSMTVSLTPLDWNTYGLAVIEKTSDGFRVKELKGGTGNFSFDWGVKCVRAGKEKFQVVRQASQ